jgi:hypothetical protein
MAKAVYWKFWKVPEPKSYEQVSLFKLTLPWLRFKWVPTINVWGGGGMWPGKTKRSGDWGKEGHIRVHLNIERQQFSQPTKELTNTRPRGLRIWYTAFFSSTVQDSAPVLQLNKFYSFRPPRKTTQHIDIYYHYIAGKVFHQMSPGKAAVEKTGQRVQKRCPLKACRRRYRLGPPLLSVWSRDTRHHTI